MSVTSNAEVVKQRVLVEKDFTLYANSFKMSGYLLSEPLYMADGKCAVINLYHLYTKRLKNKFYTFKIFSLPTIAKLREQKEVCIIHLFGKVGKPREKGFSLKVEGLEIIKLKGLGLPLAETKKNKKEKLQNGENQQSQVG